MRKNRRGSCPPFLAMFLTVVFMVLMVVEGIGMARAAVIPGSEVAPPGGTYATPTPTVVPTVAPTMPPAPETPQPTVAPSSQPLESNPPAAATQTPTNPSGSQTDPEVVPSAPTKEDPVGKYPSKVDATGIKVVSPSIDDLLVEGANLEGLLYPSGLKLPTKYMDLLMVAPVSYSTEVTGEVAYFLKTAAPTRNSTYTYAEYSAAEVYLGLCRMASDVNDTSTTAEAVRRLDTNTTVNWMYNITNAQLGNSQLLRELISTYRSILEQVGDGADASRHNQYRDLTEEHRGVYYSCGDLSCFGPDGLMGRDLSAYMLGRYSWWDYLGITHQLTSAILKYSVYYDEFAYNDINYNRGAPVSPPPSGGQSGDPGVQSSMEVHGPEDKQSVPPVVVGGSSDGSGSNWTTPGNNDPSGTPVTSVGNTTGTDPEILPAGHRSLKEIASIAAVIFVVVAVIALWAIHSYRKGQDPLFRNWK